jgi:putative transposase
MPSYRKHNYTTLISHLKINLLYTTNIVEGFHRQIRKYTKNKVAFTSENALVKLVYCACQKILEKWHQPMHNWALIASQLQIYFDGRLKLELR